MRAETGASPEARPTIIAKLAELAGDHVGLVVGGLAIGLACVYQERLQMSLSGLVPKILAVAQSSDAARKVADYEERLEALIVGRASEVAPQAEKAD